MRIVRRLASIASLAVALLSPRGLACTIAVIVDGPRVLLCNNEDWLNSDVRVWFVPGDQGRHGCVYVGFSNGWAQGGMNTRGLAFDGVAGFKEAWEHDGTTPVAPEHSAERMLESCSTVDDAILFYQRFWEPAFAVGKFLVADRTGASAVIGAKNGRLEVVRSHRSTALGYGAGRAQRWLADKPHATWENAVALLRETQQFGKAATRYSNIFDLHSGEIHFHQFARGARPVTFRLAAELAKGRHTIDFHPPADPGDTTGFIAPTWRSKTNLSCAAFLRN